MKIPQLTLKQKLMYSLNLVYGIIIAIEEATIIELLPFNEDIKYNIKTWTLVSVAILNIILAKGK
jgi:hypothetical protein